MEIYNYHQTTGEHLSTATADVDPLDDSRHLIPRNATKIAPPDCDDGYVAVFAAGEWTVVEDHRGETVYSTSTARAMTITDIGAYPDGTTTRVPCDYPVWDSDTGEWVTDSDAQTAALAADARTKRNALLAASDWTQLADCALDAAAVTSWQTYRQALRGVPQQEGFPGEVEWPVEPGSEDMGF